eukprot:TRINITY_DN83120_c0_g1_i1.p1 TRINITY_DN83120_c0_g1~~TRINITY_DN83120_c0_g1_i1.p1  ORF type:complete len:122 (-),score=13.88 TRINITY_DN83120_c0_g1_i1:99-464(-)
MYVSRTIVALLAGCTLALRDEQLERAGHGTASGSSSVQAKLQAKRFHGNDAQRESSSASFPWDSQCLKDCKEARTMCYEEASEREHHCEKNKRGRCGQQYSDDLKACKEEKERCKRDECGE